ncbi:MAG: winged helix-turn-helix transcriptional regulator [Methanobacteriota archaeon]
MPEASDALELDSRRRIFDHVHRFPGTHLREILRALAMPMGTLEYHLNTLVKLGLLTTREDARYTRYYVTSQMGRREKDVMAILRQPTPRRIATELLLAPRLSHGELLTKFTISPSTLSFHLKKLVDAELAVVEKDGRENRYTITEPDLVAKVLVQHKASFLDEAVDRFVDVWTSLAPREEPPGSGPPGF